MDNPYYPSSNTTDGSKDGHPPRVLEDSPTSHVGLLHPPKVHPSATHFWLFSRPGAIRALLRLQVLKAAELGAPPW